MSFSKGAPENQDGFTVLEMIVALTILALVLGLASQTIVMASRSVSAGNTRYQDASEIHALLAQLDSSGHQREETFSGWLVKKQPLEIGGQKLIALTIEKKTGGPASRILTFYPERLPDPP